MKKRFIVAIEKSNNDQDKAFIEFIKSNGVGWWHWLPNVWLISDSSGKLSAQMIRDQVKDIFITANLLVLELNSKGDTWSGFGPNSDKRNMFEWIKQYWKK